MKEENPKNIIEEPIWTSTLHKNRPKHFNQGVRVDQSEYLLFNNIKLIFMQQQSSLKEDQMSMNWIRQNTDFMLTVSRYNYLFFLTYQEL